MEDTVDILTLKDNTTSVEDYTTALHLLARVQVSLNAVLFKFDSHDPNAEFT
jgi:hypothetical protein